MIKKILSAAAFLALGAAPAVAADPNPTPNWSVIVMSANIAKPVDIAWQRVGGNDYCGIAKYLAATTCALTLGNGADVGSNRLMRGTINELLVGRSAHSYTYAGPTNPIFYHGTLAVEPVDAGHSKVVYTVIYDQAPLGTPEAMAADRERRRGIFQGVVDKMASDANAP